MSWQDAVQQLRDMAAMLRETHILTQLVTTLVLLAGLYLVQVTARYYIGKLASQPEARQAYWSLLRNVTLFLGAALVTAVWVEELKTVGLLLTGLVAATLLVNKEVFLGLAGRVLLAAAEPYRLGDRIRINGLCGDVIEIGLLYTWMMEVRAEDVEYQSTGRIVTVPHLWLTDHAVTNVTHRHAYLWDEIELAFPIGVDGQAVLALLTRTAEQVLGGEIEAAQRAIERLARSFATRNPPVTPVAYARVHWLGSGHQALRVAVRFAVPARRRREMHSRLLLEILARLQARGVPLYTSLFQPVPAPDQMPAEVPPEP